MEAFYRSNLLTRRSAGVASGRHYRKKLRQLSLIPALRTALVRDVRLFEYLTTNAGLLRRHQPGAIHYLTRRCMQLQELDLSEVNAAACQELGALGTRLLERARPGVNSDETAALGLALEIAYSYLAGALSISDLERIFGVMEALGFSLFSPELPRAAANLNRRGRPGRHATLFLLKGIGQGSERQACDPALLEHSVRLLESWGGEQQPEAMLELVDAEV